MANDRYKVAYAESGGQRVAVAGFRILKFPATGKTLHVDALVTDNGRWSQCFGEALLRLFEFARQSNWQTIGLDSGVHRLRAYKFHFTQRMHISNFHFDLAQNQAEQVAKPEEH